MKKWIILIIAIVLAIGIPMGTRLETQNRVNHAVNSVISDSLEFNPTTESFVYTWGPAVTREELTRRLGSGATVQNVRIGKHSFYATVSWPLLGSYTAGGSFVAKDAATGKVIDPKG